jgi:hypothetical protein
MNRLNLARVALGFAALAALTACGGDDGASPPAAPAPGPAASAPSPSASAPAPSASAPAPAPAAAKVTSFAPADGATQVNIHSTLTIAFDAALDPASVTSDHVHVIGGGQALATNVHYDATARAISIQLPVGMTYATRYTVSTSGLASANGLPVADAQATIQTWLNLALTDGAPAGAATGIRSSMSYDAQGRLAQADSVDVANPTAFQRRERCHPLPGSEALACTTWNSAGADGQWFTADDSVDTNETSVFDQYGNLLSDRIDYSFGSIFLTVNDYDGALSTGRSTWGDPGPDGVFGTADDVDVTYDRATFDSLGRFAAEDQSHGKGADGLLFSDDDIALYATRSYSADGLSARTSTWIDMGPDGKAHTADDVLARTADRTYDAHGNEIRYVRKKADGTVLYYETCEYDANDNRVRIRDYFSPGGAGPDGVWLTADDVVSSETTFDTTR